MPGLPKEIIKKYGVSKKAWEVFRGRKTNKEDATSTHRGKTMAKKKGKSHKPKRIAILPVAGFGTGLAFGHAPGRGTAIECFTKYNDPMSGLQNMLFNVTGIDTFGGKFKIDLWRTLNPLDFEYASALKGLEYGALTSMGLKVLGVKRKFDDATAKIPILKRITL